MDTPRVSDKSNFVFITPMESNRKKWRTLWGINLVDRRAYQISMSARRKLDNVLPDSYQIILNQYPKKEEAKSLGPDGRPCAEATRGLLQRAHIVARKIIPVGKETDRRLEQGEDPSMLEPGIHLFEPQSKMCVAHPSERKRWSRIGVRKLIRESGLSPTTIYKILKGKPVRCYILSRFSQAAAKIAV